MADSIPGVGRSLSAMVAQGSGTAETRGDRAWLLVVVVAAAGVVAAVAVDVAGEGAFPTHPVSALALGASAVAVWMAQTSSPERSLVALRSLSVSLLAYLWLGVAACAVEDGTLAAAWSAGWIPVNGLVVVVGLTVAAMPRSAIALSAVTALTTLGAAAIAEPALPFQGLATAAPESWTTRVPWLADSLVTFFSAALVVAFAALVARVIRAHVTERRHLVNCAATASMGSGLVVMCLALASLRDPGDIDPATGSVAYIVAIAFTGALAAYGNASSRWPLWAVLGYWALAVAVAVGVQASLVSPTALAVVLTSVVAAGASAGALWAAVWLERWLTPGPPRLVANVPLLSPRENEVLAAVAAGATNAGVAADLFLSERTVEQHLRSIFSKLDLGERDSSNRRVRAAAVWWQHQAVPAPVKTDNLG